VLPIYKNDHTIVAGALCAVHDFIHPKTKPRPIVYSPAVNKQTPGIFRRIMARKMKAKRIMFSWGYYVMKEVRRYRACSGENRQE
jgi:hypothetical protein